MDLIKQSAKEYYEKDPELIQTRGWLDRSDIADIVEKAYIAGAAKQREICDEEVEKAHEEGREQALAEYIDNGQPGCKLCRAALIEKACEWWDRELREVNYGTYAEVLKAFKKAMEQ